jgi:lycopene cyclase domain-containing protein
MENLYYLIYLIVVFLSALLIKQVGGIKLSFRRALMAILPVLLIFVAWDVLATELGHWSFGLDKMLGIVVLNQPLEELAFFLVIPLFYIVVWEAIRKFRTW